MIANFTKSVVEEATLEWLEGLGYTPIHASEIALDSPNAERQTYPDVVLIDRLLQQAELLCKDWAA